MRLTLALALVLAVAAPAVGHACGFPGWERDHASIIPQDPDTLPPPPSIVVDLLDRFGASDLVVTGVALGFAGVVDLANHGL